MTINTKTVTVEVDLEIRRGEDTENNGFSFDPSAQELVEGTVRGMHVNSKLTNVREEQANADILTEFEDGGINSDGDGIGVFLPMDQIIHAAIWAVVEDSEAEMPDSYCSDN